MKLYGPRQALEIAGLAALYVAVARLSLMMDPVAGFATLVWPPTGIALAVLLLYGYRYWPGIAFGAFLVNWWVGSPAGVALGIAAGNTLEAIAGAWALRSLGFCSSMERGRDVVAIVAVAAGLSTIVSASIGVLSLFLGGVISAEQVAVTWRAWWLGDFMGDLVVAPLLLTFAGMEWRKPAPQTLGRALFLAPCLAGVGAVLFILPGRELLTLEHAYLVFPALTGAALAFGVRGATVGTFLVSAIAITGTAFGRGPFSEGRLSENLFALQAFMAVLAVTILSLGVIISERSDSVRKRQAVLEIVSHELRNPLNALRLSAEVLRRLPSSGDPPEAWGERVVHRAAMIGRTAERMGELIQNLLDLGAIDSGRLSVSMQDNDAGSIIDEAVEVFRPVAQEKLQELSAALPEEKIEVVCDRDRILQVLANLIGNAIKFSPERASITVRAASADDLIRFSVIDTGPGISPDHIAHLFQRYWQAEPKAQKGIGLGLFIVKGLIEAHGGQIWVESRVGAGTTFHFTLRGRVKRPGVIPLSPTTVLQ